SSCSRRWSCPPCSSPVRLEVLAMHPLRQSRCLPEPLGARRGDADAQQVRALLEEQEPWFPDGPVLRVGPVQRLDLPPAREEAEQRTPQPQHRSGAETPTTFED